MPQSNLGAVVKDPDFSTLSRDEQDQVVSHFEPTYSSLEENDKNAFITGLGGKLNGSAASAGPPTVEQRIAKTKAGMATQTNLDKPTGIMPAGTVPDKVLGMDTGALVEGAQNASTGVKRFFKNIVSPPPQPSTEDQMKQTDIRMPNESPQDFQKRHQQLSTAQAKQPRFTGPVATAVKGAAALAAPDSVQAPSDDEWKQAQIEAGENLAGTTAGGVITEGTIKAPAVAEAASNLNKRVNPFSIKSPERGVVQAVKPGISGARFTDALPDALRLMKDHAERTGNKLGTLDEGLDAIKGAKQEIWNQIPQSDAAVDASPVADAMESGISARTQQQNPGQAEALRARADTYRSGSFKVPDLEKNLEEINAELAGHYAKNNLRRWDDLAAHPDTAVTYKEGEALRSIINSSLDPQGEGAGVAELKRRYGALRQIEEPIMKRNIIGKQANPNSLSEQINFGKALRDATIGTGMGIAAGHSVEGAVIGAAGGLGEYALTRWLAERQRPDSIFRRSMAGMKNNPLPQVEIKPGAQQAELFPSNGPGMLASPGAKPAGNGLSEYLDDLRRRQIWKNGAQPDTSGQQPDLLPMDTAGDPYASGQQGLLRPSAVTSTGIGESGATAQQAAGRSARAAPPKTLAGQPSELLPSAGAGMLESPNTPPKPYQPGMSPMEEVPRRKIWQEGAPRFAKGQMDLYQTGETGGGATAPPPVAGVEQTPPYEWKPKQAATSSMADLQKMSQQITEHLKTSTNGENRPQLMKDLGEINHEIERRKQAQGAGRRF